MVGMLPRKRPPPPAARHALVALASTLRSTWLLQALLLWLVHLDILLEAGPAGGRDMCPGTRLLIGFTRAVEKELGQYVP